MKNKIILNSPLGELFLGEEKGKITYLKFEDFDKSGEYRLCESDILKKTTIQLEEYFAGRRKVFELPIELNGTEFRKKCWAQLLKIPYGKTAAYKDIAIKINNPKACRAVGLANNKNPIAIVVPCHRVIGANGKMVGYAGGVDKKTYLLNLEKFYNC